MEHGLTDLMLINSVYYDLNNNTKRFLDKESKIPFIINKHYDAFTILHGILAETSIIKSLERI
jgi:hypothetical protein